MVIRVRPTASGSWRMGLRRGFKPSILDLSILSFLKKSPFFYQTNHPNLLLKEKPYFPWSSTKARLPRPALGSPWTARSPPPRNRWSQTRSCFDPPWGPRMFCCCINHTWASHSDRINILINFLFNSFIINNNLLIE